MIRRFLLLLGCFACLFGAAAVAQQLPASVESALAQARVPREALAIYVAPVDAAGIPRIAHRSEVPVNPASVAKLVTTYAGLDLLGPAFTWLTPVFIDGSLQSGTLSGNVYIQGRGDPKLVHEKLWLLMRRLQGAGVRRIEGDIVLDRGAFTVPPSDPGAFDGEPLRPYNAAPDALLVNFKSVVLTFVPDGAGARVIAEPALAGVQWPASVPLTQGDCSDWRGALRADYSDPLRPRFAGGYASACGERSWPLAFADPSSFAARAVAAAWRDIGGELAGVVREGRVPAGMKPLFTWESPTLAEVVRDINKFSNNVMAQQLFLTLALQHKGSGTFPAARELLRAWWTERFGGEPPVLDNGSGLSRNERITARQLGQLLQAAWVSPVMPELMASLSASGQDGTLRRRRSTAGLAHLKTGSLRDVAGIAGYVHAPGGRRFVLVAIANHPNANAVRPALDALIDWTARQ